MFRVISWLCLLPALLLPFTAPAWAEESAAGAQALMRENQRHFIYGPATVDLGDQATMRVAHGQAFIPAATARKLLEAQGSQVPAGLMGLVMPGLPGQERPAPADAWVAFMIFDDGGYVGDGDAREWNKLKVQAIMDGMRKATDAANRRRPPGTPEREMVGWVDQPHYDSSRHHLTWSVAQREKGRPETAMAFFSMTALGRQGTLAFGFTVPLERLATRRRMANTLLESITFKPGKRYEDFNGATDKVAATGLTGLIQEDGAKGGLMTRLQGLSARFGVPAAILLLAASLLYALRRKPGEEEA